MNTQGFIVIKRSIQEWPWYGDMKILGLWVHLLVEANYKDSDWNGVQIKRGQLVTTLNLLARDTGLTVQEIRTAIRKLIGAKEISTITRSRRTIVTICNYDSYQIQQQDSNTIATRCQHDISEQYNNITREKEKGTYVPKEKDTANAVDRLYALYPSSAVRVAGNRVSLKSSKDKDRLTRLLKTRTEEELANIINRYLSEDPGAYTKMFSTFLNNLPDYSEAPTDAEPTLSLYDQMMINKKKPQEA